MTRIYLIRHAHAHYSEDERRPLSPSGREDALRVARRLASEPIAAIYSSPSQRAVETVEPLADRLGLRIDLEPDLRERELPTVPFGEFDTAVLETWRRPGETPFGGEPNARAQARGLAVFRRLVGRHDGAEVAVATHGTLLVLILNALDSSFGYDFWRGLTFPDIYRVAFQQDTSIEVTRIPYDEPAPPRSH